jgi:4-amino-4-deoxy-L-arabinose transferase-like glycosyltransferase
MRSGLSRLRGLLIPVVLLALAVLVWMAGPFLRELADPDEGRYAEIAREMLQSGDWITPRLNGIIYMEKPPLQYWVTAAGYWLFGVGAASARLWPVLSGLLTVLMVAVAATRRYGAGVGLVAASMLASSLLFFMFGQILTLDMGLSFFMTASLIALMQVLDEQVDARGRKNAARIFWVTVAGAILSKGLVAVVLPGAAVLLTMAVVRRFDWMGALRIPEGLVIIAAIALPWHLAMRWRHPSFVDFYLIGEHFRRYLQPAHHRPGPWYAVALFTLLGALPWTLVAVHALGRSLSDARRWFTKGWRSGQGHAQPHSSAVQLLPLFWCLTIVAFFSLSSSKLPGYVVPALPALALVVAAQLGPSLAERSLSLFNRLRVALPALLAAILLLVAALAGPKLPRLVAVLAEPGLFQGWFAAGAAWMVIAAAVAFTGQSTARIAAVALLSCLAWTSALQAVEQASEAFSVKGLVAQARADGVRLQDPRVPVFAYRAYDQTLPFLLGRPVTLVGYADEFANGLGLEPTRGIGDDETFARLWRAGGCAYALTDEAGEAYARAQGLPVHPVATGPRLRIIAAHAECARPAR